ncbi:hypothetical protein EMGBS8_17280 [Verrucomicrobiota bacterium]|nr:hypothetical protein EMGBS8_17280 [Verrucomicrobiota bacterium]
MRSILLLFLAFSGVLRAAGLPADFVTEQPKLQAVLTGRVSTLAIQGSADLREFESEAGVGLTLLRYQLLRKVGTPALQDFRKDRAQEAFLVWLWDNPSALHLFLEGATPLGLTQRDEDKALIKAETLALWSQLWNADPESREGLFLRLAIATALLPPGQGNHGAGQQVPPPSPTKRYQHFKQAYLAKELYPSFVHHSVWEYMQVVSSPASDADLAWTRQVVNTWRPDLRAKEQVVKTVSEVKYGNSPHPYGDYKDVLNGGGKCGPRSSWGVMVCQAFGIPAVGVGQPGHACVAFKTAYPETQPQPGNIWKVDYGAGWEKSRIYGLSGTDFLQAIASRSRSAEFTRTERLRWLAAAVTGSVSAEKLTSLKALLTTQMKDLRLAKPVFGEGDNAAEAEREPATKPAAPLANKAAASRVGAGIVAIPATAFSKLGGARVHESTGGGRQVYFEKNAPNTWAEYPLEVSKAGKYLVVLQAATPNTGQAVDLLVDGRKLATLAIPNSLGLWAETPPVEVELAAGPQVLRFAVPSQRGLAVKQIKLQAR